MKLVRFIRNGSGVEEFGFVLGNRIISFAAASRYRGNVAWKHEDMCEYLRNLPSSEDCARKLHDYTLAHLDDIDVDDLHELQDVRFLTPVKPPAMIDFGLTPRHLKNSAMTLLRYEYGSFVQRLIGPFLRMKLDRMSRADTLPYYKCNHLATIGDREEVGWPSYTSYLDIEPELGIVAGTADQPIAGYVIFNDMSARDVQMPEMMGTGPARSKDFTRSKGLGPYLVTVDEVPDPLNLQVDVRVGGRFSWRGSTSEYIRTPREIIDYLKSVFTPAPGTVIGMGTVPDCTGLDNDLWLLPGDDVSITVQGLGTLHQQVPVRIGILAASRWKNREELKHWYVN